MTPTIFEVIIIGLLVGMNVFYGLLTHYERRSNAERENRLIKAVIAKDLQEYSAAEASPADEIEKLDKENELALAAAEIEKTKETAIPIY